MYQYINEKHSNDNINILKCWYPWKIKLKYFYINILFVYNKYICLITITITIQEITTMAITAITLCLGAEIINRWIRIQSKRYCRRSSRLKLLNKYDT